MPFRASRTGVCRVVSTAATHSPMSVLLHTTSSVRGGVGPLSVGTRLPSVLPLPIFHSSRCGAGMPPSSGPFAKSTRAWCAISASCCRSSRSVRPVSTKARRRRWVASFSATSGPSTACGTMKLTSIHGRSPNGTLHVRSGPLPPRRRIVTFASGQCSCTKARRRSLVVSRRGAVSLMSSTNDSARDMHTVKLKLGGRVHTGAVLDDAISFSIHRKYAHTHTQSRGT